MFVHRIPDDPVEALLPAMPLVAVRFPGLDVFLPVVAAWGGTVHAVPHAALLARTHLPGRSAWPTNEQHRGAVGALCQRDASARHREAWAG